MATSSTRPSDPRFSPTYPQRVHIRERAQWNELLANWDRRVDEAAVQLSGKPDRIRSERLLAQMQGARDQIAEAVRRLPMEVGDLYEEDRRRLDEAVHALERMFTEW